MSFKATKFLTATAVIALSASAALAQSADTSTEKEKGLKDIVVTATKVEANVQKIPLSVTVKDGDEMRSQNKRRIDEIVEGSISVAVQESQVGPQFYMRGVGQTTGMPSSTNEQPIALYIDGVYQPRTETIRGGSLDLERAEVLRGPQGTNLGTNALAGAISLITAAPKFEPEARVVAGIGNLNQNTLEGMVNMPISDTQALRLAASSDRRDGFYSSGLEDNNNKVFRARYRYKPQDGMDFLITGEYQKIGGYGPGQGSLSDSKDSDGVDTHELHYFRDRANPWDDGTPKGTAGGQPLGFKNTKLKSVYASASIDLGSVATMTFVPSYQDANYISVEAARGGSRRSEDRTQKTSSAELRFGSSSGSKLQWLVGGFYYHTNYSGSFKQEDALGDYTLATGGPDAGFYVPTAGGRASACTEVTGVGCVNYTYADGDMVTTKSLFGNFKYPVIEGFRVSGGLRYSNDKKRVNETTDRNSVMEAGTSPAAFQAEINPEFTSGKHATSKLTYSAGVEWDLADRAMAYATYATGYKSGNVSLSFNGLPQTTKAQILTSRTIGLKSRWLDNSLQFNVELFDNFYNNYSINICTEVVPGGCSFPFSFLEPTWSLSLPVNYPKLVSRGVDIDIDYKPTQNDHLQLAVGYLDSKFGAANPITDLEFATAGADTDEKKALLTNALGAYAGTTLQNSPKWSFDASYEHVFNLGDEIGTLSARANLIHKSKLYSNFMGGSTPNDTASVQPAYTTYNAFLTYETPGHNYQVTAYVRNISNYPVMTNFSSGGPDGTSADLGAPRQYGMTFTANF